MKTIHSEYALSAELTSNKAFVGIDLSMTSTAIAVLARGKLEITRVKTEAKHGSELARFNYILHQVLSVVADVPDGTDILIEGYAMGVKGSKVFSLGELGGIVKYAIATQTAHCMTIVPPNTLKLFTTGKGVGDKTAITMALYKKYGIEIQQNDEADGAALAIMGFRAYSTHPRPAGLAYEMRALEGVQALGCGSNL